MKQIICLAEATNFSPPMEIAAWLACAGFILWFLLLVDKAIQRMRGDSPEPPNGELKQSIKQLAARMKVLEEWKDGLIQKLDEDKMQILEAGEKREEKLSGQISVVNGRLDNLNSVIGNLPGEFFAMLANAKNLLGKGPQ